MAIVRYLALTAGEFAACRDYPKHPAWMACHFSPYGTGLTNLPDVLPEGSLLIVNDRTPICGHDPILIRDTLADILNTDSCGGLLLDFQRPGYEETAQLIPALLSLPCPVAVSETYAADLSCPVFLPPVPLEKPLEVYLSPWSHREIWLELALDGLTYTVTAQGCTRSPLPVGTHLSSSLQDHRLHCHYQLDLQDDCCSFLMQRTADDIDALLQQAETLGVTTAVGFYQEFCQ